jgi:hypothetical protein
MSVITSTAPNTRSLPNRREIIEGVEPLATAPAFFGPPVLFLLTPWLLLVLLLIGPAALLITFVLAFVVVAAAVVALAALLASPYLIVRHLRSRHRASQRRFAFMRRPATDAPRLASSASVQRLAASN